jgi:hypothetical protein
VTLPQALRALLSDGYDGVAPERQPSCVYELHHLIAAYARSVDDGWWREGPRLRHPRFPTLRGAQTRGERDRRG